MSCIQQGERFPRPLPFAGSKIVKDQLVVFEFCGRRKGTMARNRTHRHNCPSRSVERAPPCSGVLMSRIVVSF